MGRKRVVWRTNGLGDYAGGARRSGFNTDHLQTRQQSWLMNVSQFIKLSIGVELWAACEVRSGLVLLLIIGECLPQTADDFGRGLEHHPKLWFFDFVDIPLSNGREARQNCYSYG